MRVSQSLERVIYGCVIWLVRHSSGRYVSLCFGPCVYFQETRLTPPNPSIPHTTQRGDYVKKMQGVDRHEERMYQRSGEAINERLARLGLPALPKTAGPKKQQQGAAVAAVEE